MGALCWDRPDCPMNYLSEFSGRKDRFCSPNVGWQAEWLANGLGRRGVISDRAFRYVWTDVWRPITISQLRTKSSHSWRRRFPWQIEVASTFFLFHLRLISARMCRCEESKYQASPLHLTHKSSMEVFLNRPFYVNRPFLCFVLFSVILGINTRQPQKLSTSLLPRQVILRLPSSA